MKIPHWYKRANKGSYHLIAMYIRLDGKYYGWNYKLNKDRSKWFGELRQMVDYKNQLVKDKRSYDETSIHTNTRRT